VATGNIAPVLVTTATIYPEGRAQSVLLKGISKNQKVLELPTASLEGEWGDIPAIIGKRMAEKNRLEEGDLLTLRWRDVDGTFDARDVVITEIFSCNVPSIDAGHVWIPLNTLQEMMQLENEATILISSVEEDAGILSSDFVYKDFDFLTEEITKMIKKFGGERMETYQGEDVTPLWDLKGEGLNWSFKHMYSAPKLEKIVHVVQSYRDKLMVYGTIIWPDDQHALPIYSDFWAESAKGSFFLLDFYPIADCICDIPYMEKNLEHFLSQPILISHRNPQTLVTQPLELTFPINFSWLALLRFLCHALLW